MIDLKACREAIAKIKSAQCDQWNNANRATPGCDPGSWGTTCVRAVLGLDEDLAEYELAAMLGISEELALDIMDAATAEDAVNLIEHSIDLAEDICPMCGADGTVDCGCEAVDYYDEQGELATAMVAGGRR